MNGMGQADALNSSDKLPDRDGGMDLLEDSTYMQSTKQADALSSGKTDALTGRDVAVESLEKCVQGCMGVGGDMSLRVRSVIGGEVILGSELFSPETTIADLKARLLDPAKPQALAFLVGPRECRDLDDLLSAADGGIGADGVLELCALFKDLRITKGERRQFFRALNPTSCPNDILLQFPEAARADHGLVHRVVTLNGLALEHAHSSLRADRSIVSAAIGTNGLALLYADPALQADRSIALKAVKKGGAHQCMGVFKHLCDALRRDEEIALAACTYQPNNLQNADMCLRADAKFVLQVLFRTKSARALEHASQDLKDDKEFMIAASRIDGRALCYAAPTHKDDREFILAAVDMGGCALDFVPEKWLHDEEVVRAALGQNGQTRYRELRLRHKDRISIVMQTVQNTDVKLARLLLAKWMRDPVIRQDAVLRKALIDCVKTLLKADAEV